jgi:hypothetical protein
MSTHEVVCPHCNKAFTIDEAGYADILKQVRDREFEADLHERMALMEKANKDAIKLAEAALEKKLQKEAADKDAEIAKLAAELKANETAKKLAVTEAVNAIEKERDKLKAQLDLNAAETKLAQESAKSELATIVKLKDDEIARLSDYKARLSTKMIGETLEQHCENSFNAIRATAFPNAFFEKDNDVKSGSKGDYIFRDLYDGIETVSIMFEMKNESDTTATKKKNEDFFKELDKDRNEKGCEYAVLVSLLEPDSELYNGGIVDVSYKYPKMYVIRPQFFISLISLLRNASQKSLQYKQELELAKAQTIDLSNFEANLLTFKDGFQRNFDLFGRQYDDAIKQIDASIKAMEAVKAQLGKARDNLRLANDKAQNVSVKKLTAGSPSIREQLAAIKANQPIEGEEVPHED